MRESVINHADCYPFGMRMAGRYGSEDGAYRYGFNGYESDDEIKGAGNSYTTLFRQYDPRVGRWISLDPAMSKYPSQSPYAAFNNNPIYWTDPFGDDPPEKGEERSAAASSIQEDDTRTYDQVNGSSAWTTAEGKATVDCSEFCREVSQTQGYNPGRTSRAQAKYYQKKGEWTTDVSELREGDFVFWKNKGDINHTGIVTDVDANGKVTVTHAGVQGAKRVGDDKNGGKYTGGRKSLVTSKLDSDGGVWGKTFVGAGRPSNATTSGSKPVLATSNAAEVEMNKDAINDQVRQELLEFYQGLLKESKSDVSRAMLQNTINELQQ